MAKYILRFDDFSRYSSWCKWRDIVNYLKWGRVPALIGVIPDCKDEKLMKGSVMSDYEFWRHLSDIKSFDIGMHGYNHENFGAMSKDEQLVLMMRSMARFAEAMVVPNVFIAPNHSVNDHTFDALKMAGIEYLSDGVGLYPWRDDSEVMIVPQILWTPREVPMGVITFCMHPDTMSKEQVDSLMNFIERHRKDIISIYEAEPTPLSLLNMPFRPVYGYFYKKRFGRKKR